MEVVWANGLEIAYERVGQGPPLVLVHGAAEDGRSWQPQIVALADDFTVVAWDEPGAGRSSDIPAGFSLADYASGLAAVIEDLGPGPAHVAGLSWGGTVALELYRHHPGLVATLILADTYAGWKGSLSEDELRARVAWARDMLAAPAEEFDPTFPGLFAGDPPVELLPVLEEIAADVRRESLGTQLVLMGRGRPARPAASHHRADTPDLGRAGRALTAHRRTPARGGDPGLAARRDPRLWPPQQPRAVGSVQRGRA